MEILEAFCNEINRNVSIYEAQHLFFESEEPRKKFSFGCSDQKCRRSSSPVVIGVNYHKTFEDGEKFVKPHYRRHGMHSATCFWAERNEAAIEYENEEESKDDSNRSRKFLFLKCSDVIDVFSPVTAAGNCLAPIDNVEIERISALPTREQRIGAHKERLRLGLTTTSRLEELVFCFENMSPKERNTTRLRITNGGTSSYRDAFEHVKYYAPGESRRIYYGGVDLGNPYGLGFSLGFMDRIVLDEEDRHLSLYVSSAQLKAFPPQAYLLEKVKALRSMGKTGYATCYFYGDVAIGKKESQANVILASLHNFVLILRTKESK